MLVGTQLVAGTAIAGTSVVVEGYTMREFPKMKKFLSNHKALAIGTSIGITYVICMTTGAVGVTVLIGQLAGTAGSMAIIYRKPKTKTEKIKLGLVGRFGQFCDTHVAAA